MCLPTSSHPPARDRQINLIYQSNLHIFSRIKCVTNSGLQSAQNQYILMPIIQMQIERRHGAWAPPPHSVSRGMLMAYLNIINRIVRLGSDPPAPRSHGNAESDTQYWRLWLCQYTLETHTSRSESYTTTWNTHTKHTHAALGNI